MYYELLTINQENLEDFLGWEYKEIGTNKAMNKLFKKLVIKLKMLLEGLPLENRFYHVA